MQPTAQTIKIVTIVVEIFAVFTLIILYNQWRKSIQINKELSAHNQDLQRELEAMEAEFTSDVGTVNHITDRERRPTESAAYRINRFLMPSFGGNLLYKVKIDVWDFHEHNFVVLITPTKEDKVFRLFWVGSGWYIEQQKPNILEEELYDYLLPQQPTLLDEELYSTDLSKKIAKFIKDGRNNKGE